MNQIAVISGKGGTGKSSITAAFATLNKNIILADCDVDAANLFLIFNPTHEEETVYIGSNQAVIDYDKCTNCGICKTYCRFDAIDLIDGRITISETYCDGCFLCSRIVENAITMIKNDKSRMYSGAFRNGQMVYGRLAPGEENTGKLVNIIRDKTKQLAKEKNIELILLDGPAGIGCPVISTITGVNKIVIVTEPSVSGFLDMKRAVEMAQKFNVKPMIIVNKFNLNEEMSEQITAWCKTQEINIVGYLPFESEVITAMVQQKSVIEYNKDLEISKAITNIFNNIMQP